jgi:uncharacterized membrane protein YidH (DUF202 family)
MKKKLCSVLCLLLVSCWTFAQDKKEIMADTMRSNGKIYVVVAVILTIFAGIIIYLVRLDRKITKLEKNHS